MTSLLETSDNALTPVVPRTYTRFVGDAPERVDAGVIGEIRFTIFVDERELVTLMCSPWQLRPLVVGFLYLEGLIESIDDLELLRVCLEIGWRVLRAEQPGRRARSTCVGGRRELRQIP